MATMVMPPMPATLFRKVRPLEDSTQRNQLCAKRPIRPSQVLTVKTPSARASTFPAAPATTAAAVPEPRHYPKLHLGMFEIGKPLGKGKFGRVYLVRHRTSGYVCALKVLNKEEITAEGAEAHVRREIEVHSRLRHPSVIGFHGWFHDSRRVFIVQEFAAGGELFKSLRRVGRFSQRRSARYAAQVAQALAYLHARHVMHRDLKPENVLVGLRGELKLADFGYSVHAPGNRRETLCGTLDYLPPEMLSQRRVSYSRAVDQWTLGVLTYEFLTGEAPFDDQPHMTKKRIVAGDMKPLPASIGPEARDFVHSVSPGTVV
ncbi:Protein kinase-like domain protein [Cordyceps fumosorosea ARSEF 2679]|uniref:Aurora kinase n=1 Tax=Cordyceps fumosorosea (strain ARSEF 2679) TaxID=1081104 RepID=A0A167W054_CORFA|nr:Protein kinase-like domain protein [Cordyceps fumosorosea ARSEF 2679]OAA63168.1 Protein kinase-like domain protein [Cordyceps fumosorosea ARSEF 2679]